MSGTGGFRTLFARLAGLRATAKPGAFDWTPEADRMRSALEMHELGVQLYRQRMRREHPGASQADLDGLVRAWLTAPPPDTRLGLLLRERMASPVESVTVCQDGVVHSHKCSYDNLSYENFA